MAERRRSNGRNRNRPKGIRRTVVIGGLVVVVAAGAGFWVANRQSPPTYRLATAGPSDVTSTLATTGSIEAVSQSSVGFPVAGQVNAVNVHIGQVVHTGDVLAQLDTTALSSQLSSAQSKLASTQAKLANDQNSQSATATPASGSGATGGGATGGGATGGQSSASGRGSATSALAGPQAQVLAAQRKVDADLKLADAAVKQENATCRQVLAGMNGGSGGTHPAAYTTPSTSDTETTTETPPPTTTTAPPPTSTTAPPPTSRPTRTPPPSTTPGGGGQAAQCQQLIQQVLDVQNRTAADEKALAAAEQSLTAALAKATASAGQSGASRGTGSTPTGGAGGSSSGRSAIPITADQLAADQAAVDAADAEQAVVQQSIAAATLVSPIDGTVAQVGLTAGQTASSVSGSDKIVVIGPGADQITTAVSDSQVGQVKIGQQVAVIPDGSSTRLTGKVTQIGALGSTTSSGVASYPVTISLDQNPQNLFPGATASVSITLSSTHATVTVPTSAVHTTGPRHTVSVLRNGQLQDVRVEVGVTGSTVSEITSGLNSGDTVVLADLNAAIPTAGNPGRALTGGGGGGGGGGRPGGTGGGGGGFRPGGG